MWWGEQCQCLLTLADSEHQDAGNHSSNWVTVGKAKQGGEGEMGKYLSMSGEGPMSVYLPKWGMLLPTGRETLTTHRGVASHPPLKMMKNQNLQRNQNQQPEHEDMLAKGGGSSWIAPEVSPGLLG